MKRYIAKIYDSVINPPEDAELAKARGLPNAKLPALWLLGKTGAGKSTIVRTITGESAATIGNGFEPCTRNAQAFKFPADQPIMRFLDTRGLGEVDYDPAEDIAALGQASHAVVVVMRLREAEQSAVLEALETIRASAVRLRNRDTFVVYTGATEIADAHDRNRAIDEKQKLLENAWGQALNYCLVDCQVEAPAETAVDTGETRLRELLAERLPEISLWLNSCDHDDAEKANFDRLSSEVLWYAGAAAASDAEPVVGLVSVPANQGKMLHSLARKYGIEWDKRTFSEFTAALGSGFALSYATSHGARQLAKLIPGYG